MHRHHTTQAGRWRIVGVTLVAATAVVAVPGPVQAASVNVTAADLAFAPASVTVELTANEQGFAAPHAHVVWTMTDAGIEHTVTFDDPKLVSSGPLGAGKSHEAVISRPGTYPYRCTIHPSMTGTVIVTGAALTTSPSAAPAAPSEVTPTTDAPAVTGGAQDGGANIGLILGIGAGVAAGAGLGWLIVRRRAASAKARG